MKYLEKGQLLTLDDNNKYVVIDSIVYENNNFVYIVNSDDLKDQTIALATCKNDEINVHSLDYQSEDNKELINTLSNLFVHGIMEFAGLEG